METDEISGYAVMEEHAGWGSEYPDDLRNDKAHLKACFTWPASPGTSRSTGRASYSPSTRCARGSRPEARQRSFCPNGDAIKLMLPCAVRVCTARALSGR